MVDMIGQQQNIQIFFVDLLNLKCFCQYLCIFLGFGVERSCQRVRKNYQIDYIFYKRSQFGNFFLGDLIKRCSQQQLDTAKNSIYFYMLNISGFQVIMGVVNWFQYIRGCVFLGECYYNAQNYLFTQKIVGN
eukprot:TRINITY_DN7396_c0_g1_i1.p2 TRINITY_DN7396_c0_g1~~TRINITY_DN7396_c0_g1_i1.p2  ORF type:complete len:132 (+),score=4.68 TRINITY_DN7396_c0_g1_i1:298-693(+)